jgi:AAA domain
MMDRLGHEMSPGEGERPPPPGGHKKPRFPLVAFDDVLMSTAAFYLVKNLIPRDGLVVVWGPPKCGKSFWAFDLLMHVALGWEYRGLRVKGGPVVYCALEGGKGFTRRIEAYRRTYPKSKGAAFHLMSTPLDLIHDHKALIASIRTQLPAGVKPVAVALDTLNRSLNGSESKDEDMAAYVRAADAIRAAFDCVVVIVHHCGVNSERPRGHTSLTGAADVQIATKRDLVDNIVATVEWAKDGLIGLEIVSRLVVVDLGVDEDGEAITSCVIEEVKDGAAKTAAKKPKGQRSEEVDKVSRALVEAYERLADAIDKVPGFDGKPVKKVEIKTLRDAVKSRGFLEINDDGNLTGTARKHFQRAKIDLITSNYFIEDGGKFWKLATEAIP